MGGGGSSKKHMSLVFSRNKLEGHVANTNRDVTAAAEQASHQEYFLAKNICLRVAALVPLLFAFCNQGSSESQILRIDFNLNAVKIAAK